MEDNWNCFQTALLYCFLNITHLCLLVISISVDTSRQLRCLYAIRVVINVYFHQYVSCEQTTLHSLPLSYSKS